MEVSMEVFELGIGQPVRSLQTFLREISRFYNIPPVIPDGIYGTQTRDSVLAFQQTFLLNATGEVDNDTWDKIVEVYTYLIAAISEPKCVKIYPSADFIIDRNDESEHLHVIQSMVYVISTKFDNITSPEITGKHDEKSVQAIKDIQIISNLEPTGVIDRFVFDMIADMYEIYVSRNRLNW